jgi:hypothetical protein
LETAGAADADDDALFCHEYSFFVLEAV